MRLFHPQAHRWMPAKTQLPGMFTVVIRGKWACEQCEALIYAPVPEHVIDKGIQMASLLAHVMVAKFAEHLPLYRQEKTFVRADLVSIICAALRAEWWLFPPPLDPETSLSRCQVLVRQCSRPDQDRRTLQQTSAMKCSLQCISAWILYASTTWGHHQESRDGDAEAIPKRTLTVTEGGQP